MVKILHVLNSGSFSGAENVVINIINNMRDEFDFVYCSAQGNIKDVLKKQNIDYMPFSKMSVSNIKRIVKTVNPDIIHAHDFTASIIAAFASCGKPVISHIHNNPPWIKKYCLYSFAYRTACFNFKKILGVSSSVFDEYVFGKQIKCKSKVIGNPIDIEAIRKKAGAADAADKFDVVFLGRLTEQKDPLKFLNIIAKLKKNKTDVKAVMIGDGELRRAVEEKIDSLNLKNNVVLAGFLDNPYGILENSKILCMPSRWEGFGLAAIEALALGVPVAASGVGGIVDIVDSSCGLLCNTDDNFIFEIEKLLNDDKYYEKKHLGSKIQAERLNNIKEYVNTLEDIYLENTVGR